MFDLSDDHRKTLLGIARQSIAILLEGRAPDWQAEDFDETLLQAGEIELIELEISVMGPIEPVVTIEDIVLGRDGLIISRGRFAGLLLPQVATEYEWDCETFLDQTCLKAGLPRGAWRAKDCRVEKFSAIVFGE